MAKILVLTGSPRVKGNSNRMAKAFIEAAEKAGHEVTRFDTARMKINGCQGCMYCIEHGSTCVQHDDFDQIRKPFEQADVLVYVTPIYYYSYTAQLKAALDRTFCFAGNPPAIDGKRVALLTCCEEKTPDTMDGARFMFERGAKISKQEVLGEICIPGVFEAGAIENTDAFKQIEELVAQI